MADKCDVSRYHSQIVFHFDNAEDNISFLFTEEIVDDKKRARHRGPHRPKIDVTELAEIG